MLSHQITVGTAFACAPVEESDKDRCPAQEIHRYLCDWGKYATNLQGHGDQLVILVAARLQHEGRTTDGVRAKHQCFRRMQGLGSAVLGTRLEVLLQQCALWCELVAEMREHLFLLRAVRTEPRDNSTTYMQHKKTRDSKYPRNQTPHYPTAERNASHSQLKQCTRSSVIGVRVTFCVAVAMAPARIAVVLGYHPGRGDHGHHRLPERHVDEQVVQPNVNGRVSTLGPRWIQLHGS